MSMGVFLERYSSRSARSLNSSKRPVGFSADFTMIYAARLSPISSSSPTTISYKSISLLPGRRSFYTSSRTLSHFPSRMFSANVSTLSTIFNETYVSSCNVLRERVRPCSFRNCIISFTTSSVFNSTVDALELMLKIKETRS